MDFSNSQILTQKQTLSLSTQMIQSLELMTLPLIDLQTKIKAELESNPTLKTEKPSNSNKDYSFGPSYSSSGNADEYQKWLEGAVGESESLQEHLLKQIMFYSCSPEVKETVEIIITNLDKNGFHSIPLESLIKTTLKPYQDEALLMIHQMDPIGVGVKDFRESLVVQAESLGMKEDELNLFSKLVYDNLEKMRAGKVNEVAKDLKIEEEDVNALFSVLKSLTPYPGQKYNSGFEQIIVPDLSIKNENGNLVLRLNTYAIPSLTIDEEYEEMEKSLSSVKDKTSKDAAKYLKTQIQSATNLINQINLRNTTLEKVGLILLNKQREFFHYGFEALLPLTLRQVADIVGVHETTISRITTSKYIDTDFGIFPLKALFSTAVSDDSTSKNAVKEMIRIIIEGHDGPKALSDQKICDRLKDKGVTVARRTVSKYRNELNIDSSFVRGT